MRTRLLFASLFAARIAMLPTPSHATEVEPTGKFSRVQAAGWNGFFSESPSQVGTLLSQNMQRIVDVHVVQADPLLLTGSTVSNAFAPYATSWWWYFGQSSAQTAALLTANNARLTNLKGYTVDGKTVYLPVMVGNTGGNARAWSWYPDTTLPALQAALNSSGDRLIDVSTWLDSNNARHYAGVTIANKGSDHIALPAGVPQFLDGQTTAQIKAFLTAHPGSRVIDQEDEGNGRFLALFAFDAAVPNEQLNAMAIPPDSWFFDGITTAVPQLAERSMNHVFESTGARPVSMAIDPNDSQSGQAGFDVALIRSQVLPAMSALPANSNDVAGQFDYLDNRVRTFMRQYSITGTGIAIAKGGKLVYARAYGYADTELNGGTLATPNTIFRVGSISKFITTTAILKMIDEHTLTRTGKPLSLDTLIFPEVIRPYLGLAVSAEGAAATNPGGGLEAMTLRDLLHHASGWDDAHFPNPCGGNPLVQTSCIAGQLGQSVTPTCKEMIAKWMIDKPLANAPGKVGLYSNFGFCVAQTVVDALQTSGYESYVTSQFIKGVPLIDSVHHAIQLAPASDVYTAAPFVAHDYGFPWTMLVANKLVPANPAMVDPPYGGIPLLPGLGTGGWKASPVGLLKFGVSVNQSTATGQLISASGFHSIFDSQGIMPASTGGNFGLGTEINVGNGDVYKSGGEAGGGGFLVFKNLIQTYANASCANCITWVGLVNTAGGSSDPDGPGGINQAMVDALANTNVLNAINNATVDLFPSYGLPAAK
jgi:CubicO group peptidase (beta-lactamase class C family)